MATRWLRSCFRAASWEAATAADAYGRVSGNPEGLGDSVVPLSAAHLPEA